ncbi:MAG: PEP-CTERM sorting domain-containing protein, partial [Sedimenticola sp.]
MKKHPVITSIVVGTLVNTLALHAPAQAIDYNDHYWISENGGSFNTYSNWNVLGVPGSTQDTFFHLLDSGNVYFDLNRSTASTEIEGRVNFDLRNNTYTTGELMVGHTGTGDATVANGTLVNQLDMFVGHTGTGTLSVLNGGSIETATYGVLGHDAGSSGSVTVDGAGSSWSQENSHLYVGNEGAGSLSTTNGGAVSTAGSAYVGRITGATGNALVSGTEGNEGTWSVGQNLYVGGHESGAGGTGLLDIGDYGRVTVAGALNNWSTGRVALSGGLLDVGSADFTEGTFDHTGGTLRVTGSLAVSSEIDGTTATVMLDGSQATWDIIGKGLLYVGQYANGTLSVRNGASVSSESGVTFGFSNYGRGTGTVEGPGSTLTTERDLFVGDVGDGILSVTNGGNVLATGDATLGHYVINSTGTVTVDGARSSFSQGRDLIVGGKGSGFLWVSGGGSVATGDNTTNHPDVDIGSGYVGLTSGSLGEVTIDGAGSSWSQISNLHVGRGGKGGLLIDNGGSVTTGRYGYIGYDNNSSGTVTVSGTAEHESLWTLDEGLYIGSGHKIQAGTGVLNVQSGGRVSTDGGILNRSGGTLNLSGGRVDVGGLFQNSSSATLNLSGGLLDAASANFSGGWFNHTGGTLRVTGSLAMYGNANRVGKTAGRTAMVEIDGSGATWNQVADVVIGYSGGGALSVRDGGSVGTVGNAVIGFDANVTGTASVDGGGSTWSASGMYVGLSGSGELAVTDGGSVLTTNLGVLGQATGSSGTATVDGTGSNWSANGGLYIGNGGSGSLSATNGGTVSTDGNAYIGRITGSTGNALVSGTKGNEGAWSVGQNLYVGGHESGAGGVGLLDIRDGGRVTVTGGLKNWSSGTVALSGGLLDVGSADFTVGTFNHTGGTLRVNGGSFNNGNSALHLAGQGIADLPRLVLDGASASATVTDVHLGNADNRQGELVVQNGSILTSSSGLIGHSTDSTGTVTVNGESSHWDGGWLQVGRYGEGTLNIQLGADVTSTETSIGSYSSGTGEVSVAGAGSTWNLSGNGVWVGHTGDGSLNISAGGRVDNSWASVGYEKGSSGRVNVDGGSSTWANSSNLMVGRDGTGSLTIQNGGAVSNTDGYVGAYSGSSGTATVTGAGSTWTSSGDLNVGGTSVAGGSGSLTVDNGGQVNVGGTLRIWNQGSLTINNGQASADSVDINGGTATVDGTLNATTGVNIRNGGRLAGHGTVAGLTTIGDGGIMAPGNSPGTQLFSSGLAWSNGGTYQWEINDFNGTQGSDPGWDLINITGGWDISSLTDGGFNIDITSLMADNSAGDALNFDNQQDYSLDILSYDSLIGSFDDVLFVLLLGEFSNAYDMSSSQWYLSLDELNNNLVLNYDYTDPSAVPLPASLWLFGAGLAGLWGMGRRRMVV